MLNPPEIETDRLRMRAIESDDIDAFAAMYSDRETMRFISQGDVLDRELTWRSLAFMRGHWIFRGYGMWAVDLKSTGETVGRVGLHYPEGWPDVEVGWLIARPHWGLGYASESARASVEFGFRTIGLKRLISKIIPGNDRSIRVAEKLGETYCETRQMHGREVLVYELLREDWENERGRSK